MSSRSRGLVKVASVAHPVFPGWPMRDSQGSPARDSPSVRQPVGCEVESLSFSAASPGTHGTSVTRHVEPIRVPNEAACEFDDVDGVGARRAVSRLQSFRHRGLSARRIRRSSANPRRLRQHQDLQVVRRKECPSPTRTPFSQPNPDFSSGFVEETRLVTPLRGEIDIFIDVLSRRVPEVAPAAS